VREGGTHTLEGKERKEVVLELVKCKCLPFLLYGLECCPLNKSDVDYVVDPDEVEYRLANINIFKAPGPDGIPSWLLRDFAPYHPLAAIFNASIREGYFPPIWKSADVIPVPKIPRPRSIHTDLRPISLMLCLAKVLESIVG